MSTLSTHYLVNVQAHCGVLRCIFWTIFTNFLFPYDFCNLLFIVSIVFVGWCQRIVAARKWFSLVFAEFVGFQRIFYDFKGIQVRFRVISCFCEWFVIASDGSLWFHVFHNGWVKWVHTWDPTAPTGTGRFSSECWNKDICCKKQAKIHFFLKKHSISNRSSNLGYL